MTDAEPDKIKLVKAEDIMGADPWTWLGGAGIIWIIVIIGLAACWVKHLDEILKTPVTDQAERFYYVAIGLHGLVAITALYFGYQLVRFAERLLLPHWLEAEKLQLLLGIRDPIRGGSALVSKLLGSKLKLDE